MKNKVIDLNNHLFAQLERLSDEDMKPDKLEMEVQRSKAIIGIASQIVNSNRVTLDAMKLMVNSADGSEAKIMSKLFLNQENKD
jgi:hypothetical protein